MNDQYFEAIEVGELYHQYRPRVHAVIRSWLQQHVGERQYSRALDVACGTGHSTLPLLDIADDVWCLDSSESMLTHAQAEGLRTHHGTYQDLPSLGKFDLITTCMAFHWFDTEEAVAAYKAASNLDTIWLIYNFGFLGHASSDEFNEWLKDTYLARYPAPPRNQYSGAINSADPELEKLADEKGILPIEFDLENLVGYFLTQSNVEEAVRQGSSYQDVREQLTSELLAFDLGGSFNYGFTYEIFRFKGPAAKGT